MRAGLLPTKAFVAPPPGQRKPAQTEATSERSAPVTPGPLPREKPQPALKQIGFYGSIGQFNDRVARVVDAHRGALGYDPSPGVTLDVARSQTPNESIATLFAGHHAPQAVGALNRERTQNPDSFFKVRSDGVMTLQNPFQRMVEQSITKQHKVPLGKLQSRYPNVQMGILPIQHAGAAFKALAYLDQVGGAEGSVKSLGVSLPDFEKQAARVQADPLTAGGSTPAERANRIVAAEHVTSLQQAKVELGKSMGLPLSDGAFFTQDDVSKLQNWMKSADYFRKVTQYQASQAGFGNNVGAYLKSWKAKQGAVQKHGLVTHFLNAMPLQLYGHGGFFQDLASIPGYLTEGSTNPVNVGLHALTRSAGLGLDTIGGTVLQGKSDLATGHAFLKSLTLKNESFDASLKNAGDQLRRNPTWMQVFFPGMKESEFTKMLNIVGDLVLLRKATFTGERVGVGDLAAARNSTYLNAASKWSFKFLQSGDRTKLTRAAAMLEGGPGANRLVTAAFPLVKAGKMTQEQFTEHLAQMYSSGQTTLRVGEKEVTITGTPFPSMLTVKLPTPGITGRGWIDSKQKFRDALDNFDRSPKVGDSAKSFVGTLRSSVAHAAPKGALNYFDSRLPEAVYNFTNKFKIGDRELADKLSSDIVRFQAKNNVVGLQKVERQLENLYRSKYPIPKRPGMPIGEEPVAKLETEAPSLFTFPGGGLKETDTAFGGIQKFASKTSDNLNKFAKFRTRLVLSTGFSLMWKHLFGDGWRAIVGGLTRRDAEMNRASGEIETLAKADPAIERKLGVFLQKASSGETRYALGREGSRSVPAFSTGDRFAKSVYMEAAGAELRRFATSDALDAYRTGSLPDYILHNNTQRRLFHSAQQKFGTSLEEYTAELEQRFSEIDNAARVANVPDVWDRALSVLRDNRGAKADAALGEFISKNKIDFKVHAPKVQVDNGFDEVTGKAIGFLMSPNKMWRTKLAQNTLHNTYAELTRGGFDQKVALETSMDLSERIVKYHMLDFANRLQLEQDFRWLSWFATKHRLYWKWVVGTFVRQPGWAAVVDDARKQLDPQGYLNFSVFGQKLSVPAARLFWVPGKEYDETSPDAQFVFELLKTGSLDQAWNEVKTSGTGNLLTRVDTPVRLAFKAATAHTYGQAVSGLPKKDQAVLNRAFNEYQLSYYADHGHYANESDVVRHVLWSNAAEQMWRATLPLPVLPDTSHTEQQGLVRQYMMIVDPAKKREFLDKHPDVAAQFGVYSDPHLFLHKNDMFAKYTSLLDHYRAARAAIFTQAKKSGFTPELRKVKTALDTGFQKSFGTLLRIDARWAGHTVLDNQTPGEQNVPYGPWGKLVSADPQLDIRHTLNEMFPKLKTEQFDKVYGTLQTQLQAELKLLNDPKYASTYADPQELKTRRVEILQQLEAFRKLPTDALGKTYLSYQLKYVNPYWQHVDAQYEKIGKLPAGERDQAYADFAAWRDAQDHEVTVDGIKFPSPIRMAWANLDPQTRRERVRYFASKNWADLTNYEKELLTGKAPEKDISKGWQDFKTFYNQISQREELAGSRVPKGYKLTLAKYVDKYYASGFLKDYLFAQKPLYQRLPLLDTIKNSSFKSEWNYLLEAARRVDLLGKSDAYGTNQMKAYWRNYVNSPGFQSWLDSEPGFKAELTQYGPNILSSLPSTSG